jgi:multidrug efflux system membrane fusion protein
VRSVDAVKGRVGSGAGRVRRLRPGLALLPGLLLLTPACSGRAGTTRRPPAPVVVETAVRRAMPVELHAIGSVESIETVTVRPQVGGVITAVHFREGTDVRSGDLLFTIDPRPYEAALHQAEGTRGRDEASARNAHLDAERGQTLFDQGIIPREQFDSLRNTADSLDAAVQADRAAVEAARLNLAYCTIRSPISGRTGSLLVHRGNVVKAIDGGPLVVIVRTDPIYVGFSVPEQRLPEIKAALAVRKVAVRAQIPGETPRRPVEGQLTFVDNAIDATTGTVRLKGTFANRERRLWPGQFVDVVLTLGTRPEAVVVPAQAVESGQSGTFVFVVKPDLTVEARPLSTGAEVDGLVIVEKGLEGGERVVTDGQIRLVPGASVELKPPVTAPAAEPREPKP